MSHHIKSLSLILLVSVITISAYAEEIFTRTQVTESDEYQLFVNGEAIPIYIASQQYDGGAYFFANFTVDHASTITVRSTHDLTDASVLPSRHKFRIKHRGSHEFSFKARKSFHAVVEWDGRTRPLVLFANDPETDTPAPSDSHVLYYGPGRHEAGLIRLTSGQTLYLADGAVVCGGVLAEGDDITICGRGILTGDGYERWKGPAGHVLRANRCRNFTLRDITVAHSYSWTVVFTECDGVEVSGLKVCASNMLNDDAIDICNCSNVHIHHSFLRCQDDNFAIKGLAPDENRPCENIHIHDCECWTDCANVFRIGYECDAAYFRNIRAHDIDVLHYAREYREPTHHWSNCVFWVQPANGMSIDHCRFEHFRIHADGLNAILLEAKSCDDTTGPGSDYQPYGRGGTAHDLLFRDIRVDGLQENFTGPIWLEGRSEEESIRHIRLKDIRYFGRRITPDSPEVTIKDFASFE